MRILTVIQQREGEDVVTTMSRAGSDRMTWRSDFVFVQTNEQTYVPVKTRTKEVENKPYSQSEFDNLLDEMKQPQLSENHEKFVNEIDKLTTEERHSFFRKEFEFEKKMETLMPLEKLEYFNKLLK